ncbi:ABC transporter permease [Opitutales bacterium ASA1]|uniref:ABC transporter permease n=1 Tax=Congregicoccus parvus TaxID=3081749 RepID=UPI002B31BB48|nr:ABC transporter permease [Opitutales bacterium ASA1]
MKYLALVLGGLRRKKLRTAFTILSIGVAFSLFGFLGAIQNALLGGVDLAGKDRIVVRHRVSIIQNLPVAYADRIARIPDVDTVAHFSWFNGMFQDQRQPIPSFPTVPETCLEVYPEIVIPPDQIETWKRTRTGAVIGRKLAERNGWKVGDRIPLRSPIWPAKDGGAWTFDIVGIYDASKRGIDTSAMYFHYDYFDENRQWGEGMIGWYVIKVADPERTAEIAAAIDLEFANSAAETKAEPEGVFMQGFIQQLGDIGTIVMAILGAVFFTILLVAGNTMAQSVRERTEEIGVLKAIGFTDGRVLAIVLSESLAIALIGGAAGLVLGWMMVAGFAPAVEAFLPGFFLKSSIFVTGGLLALGVGFVAGVLPAMQAGRLRIAEALRRGG